MVATVKSQIQSGSSWRDGPAIQTAIKQMVTLMISPEPRDTMSGEKVGQGT